MLTDRERDALDAIKKYIEEEKIAPSIRDLGNIMGLSSTATVQRHLESLERKGYIKRRKDTPRSISLMD
ncbi:MULTISPECIES: MarR family transcriptional regulator [Clostridium]|uniref:MarR family transcriptional regulator n=1 Tax=Clostridium tertium TaxID=1559 RepID=A0A9X3XK33_9CLOT|nr:MULTISPECIES: MarR family transcriptional regulator [Clostridium]MDC4240678.1 MarR family transcriptional regulator [Clostridium tertium]MDU2158172.1 MarR family transcriptional regulator [Clostridium sp.]